MNQLHRKVIDLKTSADIVSVLKRPATELERGEAIFKNEMTEKLYNIWVDILGVHNFGMEYSFFKLGGNSLKATQLVSRIYKEFEVTIALEDIFNNATITQLIELIKEAPVTGYQAIERTPDAAAYPLSGAQQEMWLICQDSVASNAYNNIVVKKISGRIYADKLDSAFRVIVERHEILRTNFKVIDDVPYQVVHHSIDSSVVFIDMSTNAELCEKLIGEESAYVFDLEEGTLIRLSIIKLDKDEHVLILNMHHLVIDGWSCKIFLEELMAVYHSFVGNISIVLPSLTIQYRDYAAWYNALLSNGQMDKHRRYWSTQLETPPGRINLPSLQAFSGVYDYKGSTFCAFMDEALTNRIEEFCFRYGLSYYVGILAMIKALCYKYTYQEDLIVGSMASGRLHRDIDNQIGYYAKVMPIRSQVSSAVSFISYALALRDVIVKAQANQIYPYSQIVNELSDKKDGGPLYNIVVNYHETIDIRIEGAIVRPYELRRGTSKVELLFDIRKVDGKFQLDVEYSSMMYDREIISNFMAHLDEFAVEALKSPEISIGDIELS